MSETHCIVYRDVFGGWRWESSDAAGAMRDSPTAYDTREECERAARQAGVYAAPSTDTSEAASADSSFAERTILCASADAKHQEDVRRVFHPAATTAALSGREALVALHRTSFDLYVLDYWLPDWTGVSFCRDIRKIDPHAPVVFYSTAKGDDTKRRALRAGADLFLTAPLDCSMLRERLAALLRSREANEARAHAAAQRATNAEIRRLLSASNALTTPVTAALSKIVERAARAKGLDAFLTVGGTRASFERKWRAIRGAAFTACFAPVAGVPHMDDSSAA